MQRPDTPLLTPLGAALGRAGGPAFTPGRDTADDAPHWALTLLLTGVRFADASFAGPDDPGEGN